MNASAISLALYFAVAVTFILAFISEGCASKPLDRRTTIVVISAGVLWPLTMTVAFMLVVLDAVRKGSAR